LDNIALNTIFYISIFIFPGLLFRKFYFGGDFTKQFNQGNLMERFLWTLFFSIGIITFCILFFILLENYSILRIQEYISYENIKHLFETLSTNQLPEKKDVGKYTNIIYLILLLYFISGTLGFLFYKIIRTTNFDSSIPLFKFKNYWHYIIKSKKVNGNKNSKNKYLYTNADVLIEVNGKTELYSGYVHNYFIDPLTNKLDCIILKNAYKFVSIDNDKNQDIESSIDNNENIFERHRVYTNKTIYKKNIPGDILTLFNDRIVNINLTYVEQVLNLYDRKKSTINIFFHILNVAVILSPWLFKFELTTTLKRKIIIIYLLTNLLLLTKNYLFELLKLTDEKTGLKNFILAILFFTIPLLWFFKILNIWYTSGLLTLYFFVLVFIFGFFDKK